MKRFSIKKLTYVNTATADLALVGKYISIMDIPQRMNRAFPVGPGDISNSDIITSYLGFLVQESCQTDLLLCDARPLFPFATLRAELAGHFASQLLLSS